MSSNSDAKGPAVITAGAVVLAAIITGLFAMWNRDPTPHANDHSSALAVPADRIKPTNAASSMARRPSSAYERVVALKSGEEYMDGETGLILGLTEIESGWQGTLAWLRYGLPEDVQPLENVPFQLADRRRYTYRGRTFDFVIEKIDKNAGRVFIRIREF